MLDIRAVFLQSGELNSDSSCCTPVLHERLRAEQVTKKTIFYNDLCSGFAQKQKKCNYGESAIAIPLAEPSSH